MDLVVNDESPVALGEELEVQELFALAATVGEQLIGRQRDRAELFFVTAVFADLIGRQIGLVEDLVAPLAKRAHVGGEDEGLSLEFAHHTEADDGLSSAAGQHDDARPAPVRTVGVKETHGLFLIVAQQERPAGRRVGPQPDRQRSALHVTGEIFHRKPALMSARLSAPRTPAWTASDPASMRSSR